MLVFRKSPHTKAFLDEIREVLGQPAEILLFKGDQVQLKPVFIAYLRLLRTAKIYHGHADLAAAIGAYAEAFDMDADPLVAEVSAHVNEEVESAQQYFASMVK